MAKHWALVCDASRARICSFGGAFAQWHVVEQLENPAGRAHVADLVSDQPGTVRQSGTGARPTMTPHTDPGEAGRERFARDLVAHVERAHREGIFEHLVVVAPPRFLGRLRRHFSDSFTHVIAAQIDKDYSMETLVRLQELVQVKLQS